MAKTAKKFDNCVESLKTLLEQPRSAEDAFDYLVSLGYGETLIKQAKAKLGVLTQKEGFNGGHTWTLPPTDVVGGFEAFKANRTTEHVESGPESPKKVKKFVNGWRGKQTDPAILEHQLAEHKRRAELDREIDTVIRFTSDDPFEVILTPSDLLTYDDVDEMLHAVRGHLDKLKDKQRGTSGTEHGWIVTKQVSKDVPMPIKLNGAWIRPDQLDYPKDAKMETVRVLETFKSNVPVDEGGDVTKVIEVPASFGTPGDTSQALADDIGRWETWVSLAKMRQADMAKPDWLHHEDAPDENLDENPGEDTVEST